MAFGERRERSWTRTWRQVIAGPGYARLRPPRRGGAGAPLLGGLWRGSRDEEAGDVHDQVDRAAGREDRTELDPAVGRQRQERVVGDGQASPEVEGAGSGWLREVGGIDGQAPRAGRLEHGDVQRHR